MKELSLLEIISDEVFYCWKDTRSPMISFQEAFDSVCEQFMVLDCHNRLALRKIMISRWGISWERLLKV